MSILNTFFYKCNIVATVSRGFIRKCQYISPLLWTDEKLLIITMLSTNSKLLFAQMIILHCHKIIISFFNFFNLYFIIFNYVVLLFVIDVLLLLHLT